MNVETLALRVLMPGFPGTTLPPDWAELFAEGLGGVCLFGSNTADGPAAIADLTASIRAIAPDAVIAVDEEGGDVTRLHALTGSPVLGPAALGAVDDLTLTRETGRAIGLFLHDNFARPGKRSGAWMSSYRVQENLDGEVLPIVVNNNNFSKGDPTLLSFDDARTLFHEFGHGLHGLQ